MWGFNRHAENKWGNLNIIFLLDAVIKLMLNILDLIIYCGYLGDCPWSYKKYLRVRYHKVCDLL